jgi:hypothetical protein
MGQQILNSSSSAILPFVVTDDVLAGDYFYEWGAGSRGWPRGDTATFGQFRYVAGAARLFQISSSNSRPAAAGPFVEQIPHPGPSVANNTVTTAATTLASFAGHNAKCASLTNGNVVMVYMSATNTLSAAIFNRAGVQQGATVTLTTSCTTANNNFDATGYFAVSGLSTGGYVVVFRHSSTSFVNIVTVDAANVIQSGPTVIVAARQATAQQLGVCGAANGRYLIVFDQGFGVLNAVLYQANNTAINNGFTVNVGLEIFHSPNGDMGLAPIFLRNGTAVCLANLPADNLLRFVLITFNASVTGAASYTTTAGGPEINNPFIDACALMESDGWIAVAKNNNTNQVVLAGTTGVSLVGTYNSVSGARSSVIARPDGGADFYRATSTTNIERRTLSAAGGGVGSGVTITVPASQPFVFAAPLAEKAALCRVPSGTNFPTFSIVQTDAVVAGAPLFSDRVFSPTQGYYLKGIALESATAGNVCRVLTTGTIPLGATYPTLASPVYFDYQGTSLTAKSLIQGVSGVVSGTTVSLGGLK